MNCRISRTYSFAAETIQEIRKQAEERGLSMSGYLEELVMSAAKGKEANVSPATND